MVEPEMAYATLDDVMQLAERFLSYIAARVLEDRQEELKVLERDTSKLEAIVPPDRTRALRPHGSAAARASP